jgi:predicted hydrocarbon binding protein
MRLARRVIRGTHPGTRAIARVRRGDGTVDVRGSLFCAIRDSSPQPLCGYYAATISRFFELYSLPAAVRLGECRATGDRSCILAVSFRPDARDGLDDHAVRPESLV